MYISVTWIVTVSVFTSLHMFLYHIQKFQHTDSDTTTTSSNTKIPVCFTEKATQRKRIWRTITITTTARACLPTLLSSVSSVPK